MRFEETTAYGEAGGVLRSASSPYDPCVDREGLVARLNASEQAELLRVLTSPSDVRAALIGAMYEAPLTRRLAEDLMDLEADEVAYLRVVASLRERLGG